MTALAAEYRLSQISLCSFQVEVNVINNMYSEAVTVHWHGMHQLNTLWMDGIPYITQCPIHPGFSFTYRFIADPIGTHWYHSHFSNQRLDGLFGMLIVHDYEPVIPYFPVSLIDWSHSRGDTLRGDIPLSGPGAGNHFLNFIPFPNVPSMRHTFGNQLDSVWPFYSILVNGRGRQMDWTEPWPLEVFVVNQTDKYRFRVAHTGSEYPMRISIDQHELTIVGSDDGELEPINVESFWIFVAETIDFEIVADQPIDNYWMRIQTAGTQRGVGAPPDGIVHEGLAILRYDTASVGDPTTTATDCTQLNPCVVFNCPFTFYLNHFNRTCIHMSEARSIYDQEELTEIYALGEDPDEEVFVNFNFPRGPQINFKEFSHPRAPFSQKVEDQITPCEDEDCENGCTCTHIIDLPKNKVVQIVITSYDPNFAGPLSIHPIHLHGYTYAVMKQGWGPLDAVTGRPTGNNPDVNCTDDLCRATQWTGERPELNVDNPPLKNTVVIPSQGYTVVRINTNNDGYWMLHCHIQRHVSVMALLFRVGGLPKVPNKFPRCDNFSFEYEDDDNSHSHSYENTRSRENTHESKSHKSKHSHEKKQ